MGACYLTPYGIFLDDVEKALLLLFFYFDLYLRLT